MSIIVCDAGSMGHAPFCWNCADSSWWYRGEDALIGPDGFALFCSTECVDEFQTQRERTFASLIYCCECMASRAEHSGRRPWPSAPVLCYCYDDGKVPDGTHT